MQFLLHQKIHKVRCTLVSNKMKNPFKIPQSDNSKDSVTFGTKSGEAIKPEPSIPNLLNPGNPTKSHSKYFTSETSVTNKHGQSKQPRVQKSSQKTTPKVVSNAKCVTSETSVLNKHGQSKQPNVQKYSQNSTPKVVSNIASNVKCVTSETLVSNHAQFKQPSVQNYSKNSTPKVVSTHESLPSPVQKDLHVLVKHHQKTTT